MGKTRVALFQWSAGGKNARAHICRFQKVSSIVSHTFLTGNSELSWEVCYLSLECHTQDGAECEEFAVLPSKSPEVHYPRLELPHIHVCEPLNLVYTRLSIACPVPRVNGPYASLLIVPSTELLKVVQNSVPVRWLSAVIQQRQESTVIQPSFSIEPNNVTTPSVSHTIGALSIDRDVDIILCRDLVRNRAYYQQDRV